MKTTLQQLADTLGLEYRGAGDTEIRAVSSPANASTGDLCFLQERKYLDQLATGSAAAVIVNAELADALGDHPLLISDAPYASFVDAIEYLELAPARAPAGIDESARLASDADLADDVAIAALCVIESGVSIGAGTRLGPGCVVERGARIGRDCHLHAGVKLGHGVAIGDRCELHAGVVIGSDGFGLLQQDGQWRKIPHLGSVRIEDDVEIGANTTVDRGALDDTLIEQGCKLDNQIQVAHNVRIGAHTAIAACVGIAGSATIGRYCKISGAAVVLGHLQVADHVTITAMSLVTKDIKKAGVYSSGTPLLENRLWHRNNVRYKSLDQLARKIEKLDKDD